MGMGQLEQCFYCFSEFSFQVSNAELINPIQLSKCVSYKIKQHVAFVPLSIPSEKKISLTFNNKVTGKLGSNFFSLSFLSFPFFKKLITGLYKKLPSKIHSTSGAMTSFINQNSRRENSIALPLFI